MLKISQKMSNVRLNTTSGDFGVHEYFKGSWGLIVCYVADFSTVCTDELCRLLKDHYEFETRKTKILAVSCDSIDSHIEWIKDIKKKGEMTNDKQFPFPIASDRDRILSLYLNVLDAKCIDEDGLPLPCRATFVVAPDMTIQLMHFYPRTIGRNFVEILRSIDALQVSFEFGDGIFTLSGQKKLSKKDIEDEFPSSTITDLPYGKDI